MGRGSHNSQLPWVWLRAPCGRRAGVRSELGSGSTADVWEAPWVFGPERAEHNTPSLPVAQRLPLGPIPPRPGASAEEAGLRVQVALAGVWAEPGRSWREPEGKVLGGSQTSPQPISPPLPSAPTKALLRNAGPQKAQFETPDLRVLEPGHRSFENPMQAVASHLNPVSISGPLSPPVDPRIGIFFWGLSRY